MKAAALILCLALVGGSMAALDTPSDFLKLNDDAFSILTAVTLTVEDVLARVAALDAKNATDFIKGHVLAGSKNYRTAKELNTTGVAATAASGYNISFSFLVPSILTASLVAADPDNTLSYESEASVLGPMAIPTGSSTVYVVDHSLADPALITGTVCSVYNGSNDGTNSTAETPNGFDGTGDTTNSTTESTSGTNGTGTGATDRSPSPAPKKLLRFRRI
eukprot:scaffold4.g4708.t1